MNPALAGTRMCATDATVRRLASKRFAQDRRPVPRASGTAAGAGR